jgi:nitrous oxide reductase accessory protein NosL
MNLITFYKTSHAIKLKNGSFKQFCSMHCLVESLEKYKDKIVDILVVDAKTNKFVNAKNSFYVVGSKIKGTMTKNSKYAFLNEEDAKKFQKKYGGKIVNFQEALKIAKLDFKKDMLLINTKRSKLVYKKGKKLYLKKCQKIDPNLYESISLMKADMKKNNLCKIKKEKQLQAVAVYVWDIIRKGKNISKTTMQVPKEAKCPVCGMFVAKYPKWAASIATRNHKKPFYFDGVKDMMKFYFNAKDYGHKDFDKNKAKITVSDYYTREEIDAKKAFYVIGSNIYGPMGNELIPFRAKKDAKIFLREHEGKKILTFKQITSSLVYSLDGQ